MGNDSLTPYPSSASDRKTASMVHVGTLAAAILSGGIFLPILVPLIALFMWGNESQFTAQHIKTQLNFQITLAVVVAIGIAISIMTLGVGLLVAIPAVIVLVVADAIASILAALAAHRGEAYEMPFTISFVK